MVVLKTTRRRPHLGEVAGEGLGHRRAARPAEEADAACAPAEGRDGRAGGY